MTLPVLFQILLAAFKFPKELSELVRLLSKSPEEKRRAIVDAARNEAKKFEETGRPNW